MNEYKQDVDQISSELYQTETLPKGLNVLTILTFIGCAFGALFSLGTPWLMKLSKGFVDKAMENSSSLPPEKLAELEKSRAGMEIMMANLTPVLIIGIVGIVLCFVGAMMMRKLKKDGFFIYCAGQIVPVVGNFVLLGLSQFTSIWSYFFALIPFVFIALYAAQRKYLVK
ncbi:hypothetical protein ACFOWM_03805 [Ferruginibacter yonginensis]|uniref:DUF4064 domain-containing protein n=1 Tax=Ferruginibacter yonginensis TaxID=1310416 RepID=A0ABV8QNY1_9BACT